MIVDLFAGPGGLSTAARSLGYHVIGIEYDPDACARGAGHATVEGDVRGYGPEDFPTATGLAGGSPCQTFTVTGNGTGRVELMQVFALAHWMARREDVAEELSRLTDPRTGLVLEPLRWALKAVDAGRPYKTIVLEQVPQALPVWKAYAEILRAEGYQAVCGVLKAEQYGAPQTRRRAVLIARLGVPVALPAPTHRPYRKGIPQDAGDPRLLPWVSMGDVLPHRGPFTVVSNYGTGGDPKARGRRTSAEPAFTVTGKISRLRLVDPDGNELPRLTWSEAGILQGFPADYPWTGRDIGQQIGNAVPGQLARAILGAAMAEPRVAVAA